MKMTKRHRKKDITKFYLNRNNKTERKILYIPTVLIPQEIVNQCCNFSRLRFQINAQNNHTMMKIWKSDRLSSIVGKEKILNAQLIH